MNHSIKSPRSPMPAMGNPGLALALALLLSLPFHVRASFYDTFSPLDAFSAPTTQGPKEVLKEGMGKLLRFLEGESAEDPIRLGAFLEREISPYFNFSYMARWAAGPAYRRMDPMERENMEKRLKGMFLGAILRHLSNYRDAAIRYLSPRRNRKGGVVLGIGIRQDGAERRIEFHLFRTRNPRNARSAGTKPWTIADVAIDGQSALAYYRRYFSRILRSNRTESRDESSDPGVRR
uniref:ABC-type transporter Mla maintaining outer membrane lipid asymmetry, MlaC component n=1 Tax=Candidatus Kentrum sp. SD TaxID=2126332 RepID=A0A450YDE6_9GAMM|nr:MAG: ABC-type transporter Mla maintaining outer membrane lipid asymmetry, MlaC component [Candidatus Kentron sp. SD]VFK44679.1 MAG: ABC-type transporter Mla maintaining outer membrane lipid asymmetry, MlaC component [Candidatus Kentron sp. SD]VFK79418.1 MAG: ABC-type transporter Mla maintaining outer membrane lipid asymmetry, MlaC component [Candidatus Kentron sp. SD]